MKGGHVQEIRKSLRPKVSQEDQEGALLKQRKLIAAFGRCAVHICGGVLLLALWAEFSARPGSAALTVGDVRNMLFAALVLWGCWRLLSGITEYVEDVAEHVDELRLQARREKADREMAEAIAELRSITPPMDPRHQAAIDSIIKE